MRRLFPTLFLVTATGLLIWGLSLPSYTTGFGTRLHHFKPSIPAVALTFNGKTDHQVLTRLVGLLQSQRVQATFFVEPETPIPSLLPLIEAQHELGLWLIQSQTTLEKGDHRARIHRGRQRLAELGYKGAVPVRNWGESAGLTLALLQLGIPSIRSNPIEGPGTIAAIELGEPAVLARVSDFLERQKAKGLAVLTVSGLRKLHQDL